MTTTYEMNLVRLIEQFSQEDACKDYLQALRWPDGMRCLRCSSESVSGRSKRGQFECYSCHYQFSITTGTIFHDTHLPLWKWFLTTYMMIESKKGVSANQIKRSLKVSYKTAWYLCHRIRAAMSEANPRPLSGTVEADETWIGGNEFGKKGSRVKKVIVAGVVQRGGDARMQVIESVDRKTLHGFIRAHTAPETERIITDSWPAYRTIGDADTKHETVDHNIKEWVRGDVHTNTIEGVWSLFNRSLVGSYHKMSKKHMDAYLDELEWRFNNRANPYLFRDTLRKLIGSEALTFQELTA